jgi:hypothetical protein
VKWKERTRWRDFEPYVSSIEECYGYVIRNDEVGFDRQMSKSWVHERHVQSILAHSQLNIAAYSIQLIVSYGGSARNIRSSVLEWDSFLQSRSDPAFTKSVLNFAIDPTLGLPVSRVSHWDYLAKYMPSIMLVGGYGLKHSPSDIGDWREEYRQLVSITRKYYRRALRRRFFSFRPRPTE